MMRLSPTKATAFGMSKAKRVFCEGRFVRFRALPAQPCSTGLFRIE